jgi:hypothetical protein
VGGLAILDIEFVVEPPGTSGLGLFEDAGFIFFHEKTRATDF